MRENAVKRRLAEGGVVLGTFVYEFATSGIARLAAAAGADFVVFDQEHTGASLETVRTLTAAARAAGIVPLVRAPAPEYHLIAGALDAGAMGVMVPMVESAEQARLAVEWARYPPAGRRGVGIIHPGDRIGADLGATLEHANRELLVLVQIETRKGLENADAIAAVEGVDLLWIGPQDLTASLGVPGRYDDPAYVGAVQHLVDVAARQGKALGMSVATIEDGHAALRQGFRAVGYWADLWLYQESLRAGIGALRAVLE